uniref:Phosphoribulokinase n=1 Tax=Rhizophora mucronata TaxID=61149 RepID=A0A2P2PNY8_RHIMU
MFPISTETSELNFISACNSLNYTILHRKHNSKWIQIVLILMRNCPTLNRSTIGTVEKEKGLELFLAKKCAFFNR